MKRQFDELNACCEKAAALTAVMNMFDYDTQTTAPARADEYTSRITGVIAGEYHNLFTGRKSCGMIKKCLSEYRKGLLKPVEIIILRQYIRIHRELEPVPAEEYRQFKELTAKSVNAWSEAKKKGDFEEFLPVLEKIVEWKRRFAGYRKQYEKKHAGKKCAGREEYDILLGDYEPGFNMDKLDEIFEIIKEELGPVVKKYCGECGTKACGEETKNSFGGKKYDSGRMKEFCDYLAGYIGFGMDAGVIAESAHPFTVSIHKYDVRMTNNYSKGDFFGPVFSAIHETGHALYEQGISDSLALTIAGEGTSMGMHEGQSRFYENMIGRNAAFWKPVMKKVRDMFPEQMSGVSDEEFIALMNRVKRGPVRIEADELTYPFHIIIRYELEKKLISGKMDVSSLKDEWNRKYREYLGVEPRDDSEGVLQDVHWAAGEFGYFPSYVIGSAIAAQIYAHMSKIMPVEEYLMAGRLDGIKKYLTDNVFRYGKGKNVNGILKGMTGEEFNVKYYTDYLAGKYGKGQESQ